MVDSVVLESQLRSLWTGQHALQKDLTSVPADVWTRCQLRAQPACLLTDCESVAAMAEQMDCPEVVLVTPPIHGVPPEDSADCGLLSLFAMASEQLAEGREGLVWIHSRGLKLPWDAPLALRRSFTDPEDPEPPSDAVCPAWAVDEDADPDWVVGWGQVAAAQAALIDEGLGALAATLSAREDHASWSWLLASLGGVPLGEHGHIGWGCSDLRGEQLGAPAILVPSTLDPVGRRAAELFQLPDLAASVNRLLGDAAADFPGWGRSCWDAEFGSSPHQWDKAFQLAAVTAEDSRWIRCPAWSAWFPEEQPPRLFVKPDDRWEVCDVADRRTDVLEWLKEFSGHFRVAAENGRRGQWPDLPDELTNLLR